MHLRNDQIGCMLTEDQEAKGGLYYAESHPNENGYPYENLYRANDSCSPELVRGVSCIDCGLCSGAGRTEPPSGSTRRLCDYSVRLLPSIVRPAARGRRDSAGRWACHATCGWRSRDC